MRELLQTLEAAYEYPVDIEYTVNVGQEGSFVINLLQCRPLQVATTKEAIEIPQDKGEVFFHIKNSSMGRSRKQDFDILVYVDPHKYYEYPFTKKASLAKLIGAINSYCKNHNKGSYVNCSWKVRYFFTGTWNSSSICRYQQIFSYFGRVI